MNIFGRAAGFSRLRLGRQSLASLLSLALLFVTMPQSLPAQDAPAPDATTRRDGCQRRQIEQRIAAGGLNDPPVKAFDVSLRGGLSPGPLPQ